jgi:hypothetical protein
MGIIPWTFKDGANGGWAARFSQPTESVASRNQRPERKSRQTAGPRQEQKENPPGRSGGLETFIGDVSADPNPRPVAGYGLSRLGCAATGPSPLQEVLCRCGLPRRLRMRNWYAI